MLNLKELGLFFKKPDAVEFHGKKLIVWDRFYWLIQPPLVSIPYPFYFSKIKMKGWEQVPADKPVIFAISHRNAFMDPLALARKNSTQIWQLARGDAWKGKLLSATFE